MHTEPHSDHAPATPLPGARPSRVFHAEKGTLYVLATPLGNLRDITLRALDILGSADLILAEDTRVSAKLLSHYGLQAPLRAVHHHNERQNIQFVTAALHEGKSIALISDAGTPAISDPGARLIAALHEAALPIVPIPGPCAAIAALSAAGVTAEHFYFAGFLPAQAKARRTQLEALNTLNAALVFYEAPHRVRDTFAALTHTLSSDRTLIVARELTKTFETIVKLQLSDALTWLDAHPETERGELVLIVDSATPNQNDNAEAQDAAFTQLTVWLPALLEELPPARAARVAAAATGIARSAIYDRIMAQQKTVE